MAARDRPLRVAVVAEYYPRPSDPALGVWAHRQAMAVQAHGVEVRVLALERPMPPLGALRARSGRACGSGCGARAACRGPPSLDGIPVRYVRFVSPPRPLAYATWGRWAARPLGRALDELDARMALRPRARALRGAGRGRGAALDAPPGQAAAGGFGARRRPVVSRAPPRALACGGERDPARRRCGDLEQPLDTPRHRGGDRPAVPRWTPSISAPTCGRRPLAGPSRPS